MPMQSDVAELAGLVIEACLYGVLTVLTIGTLYVLLRRRRREAVNYTLLATSVLMYSLATAQIVVDCITIFNTFIPMDRATRQATLANVTIPTNAAKRAILFAMMILGDAIVIYRCWVVWAHNWYFVILPILCSVSSAVLAYMTIWATQHRIAGAFILRTPWSYGTAIFILSLAANAISTSLIAYRIWSSERQLKASTAGTSGRGHIMPVVRIIIKSGALNTAYLIAYITVLQVQKGKGSLPIVADMGSPLVGSIFSLVIVRVGLNKMRNNTTVTTGAAPKVTNGFGSMAFAPSHELSTLNATGAESIDLEIVSKGTQSFPGA
ncbi:hypothetical protein EV421DRAFT_1835228 [Armillaria borealis]|uniref:Uncharacterized protein n=1 Tax=Armillaria borealis TaxID=47425 RepID=A0AA39MIF5_9AGAR|nr:hypothetical protein EV421DRAFT_1835228 [Armillaria borealis]